MTPIMGVIIIIKCFNESYAVLILFTNKFIRFHEIICHCVLPLSLFDYSFFRLETFTAAVTFLPSAEITTLSPLTSRTVYDVT